MIFKCRVPWRAPVLAVSCAALLWSGGVSLAQSNTEWDSLYDRIIRLEHRLRGIEQGGGGTVYQQPAPAPAYGSDPATAAGLSLRIDRVEGELRNLLGQVQQLNFQMQQLSEQLRRFSEDAEFRFQELESRVRDGRSGNAAPPASNDNGTQVAGLNDALSPYGDLSVLNQYPGIDDGAGGSGPVNLNNATGTQVLGTLPLSELQPSQPSPSALPEPVEAQPLDGSVPSQQAALGNAATSGADALYQQSYDDLLRRRFESAQSGFEQFLQSYRTHQLAGNAQYWLGEAHYARGDYRAAAAAFLIGYRDFHSSAKAPDSLLKLAMSLKNLGQKQQACASFAQVQQEFPNASETIRSLAVRERRRAGC